MTSDKRARRSIRLRSFDYASDGAYFFTVVAHERRPVFGAVVEGEMTMSPFGRIAEREWLRGPELRSELELDEYVVMPNHFHAIVWLVSGDWATRPRDPTLRAFGTTESRSLAALVNRFKGSVTREVRVATKRPGLVVWQRNYYERVIRNQRELDAARRYIRDNPARWAEDRENPDVQPKHRP